MDRSKIFTMAFVGAFMSGSVALRENLHSASLFELVTITPIIALGGWLLGLTIGLLMMVAERRRKNRRHAQNLRLLS